MNNYEQLQNTLKEVFEIDKADLDFGIYRIMNQKRDQVMDFIDNRLPKEIREILASTQSKDGVALQAELDKMGRALDEAGVVRESSPKYIALQQQLANSIDTNALEQEVFSHLASFFKRYYKEGDFISMRRYKKDVYAIPYEGEEVKLHWANHDQYYIKTSEYLKNYSFKLKNGRTVHFRLKEANTEQNNNKTQGDAERRFAIYADQPMEEENNELFINFSYEPHKKSVKQTDLTADAVQTVQQNLPGEFAAIFDKAPTESNKNRTVLDKHLNDYISRNSFDYFIHKDLGGFLSRELDFYIKNEVLFIDDINTENPAFFTAQLSKIKALKTVACKVIDFLAQVEDFQKKLWLKKKFVTSTNYLITFDHIPVKYFEEIVANEAQFNEWEALFGEMVKAVDLKEQPFLVLDTKYFHEEFKERLLAEFDNLDEEIDGLLINSENFQALNMMQEKFQGKIDCVYGDPPYNAKSSEILYKNTFKHSSWISFMYDRLQQASLLKSQRGAIITAIDENEGFNLIKLMEICFPMWQKTVVSILHNPAGVQGDNFSYSHEYAIFLFENYKNIIGKTKKEINSIEPFRDWGPTGTRNPEGKTFYPIIVDPKEEKIVRFGDACLSNFHPASQNITFNEYIEVYPIADDGVERKWVFARETVEDIAEELSVINNNGTFQIMRTKSKGSHKTIWNDTKYYANIYGSKLLNNIVGEKKFDFPKSVYTVQDCINAVSSIQKGSGIILDYFAGSGTTGHATIKLNREDGGKRKYILVEMGTYFSTVTKPRIAKVIYSDNWKDGLPQDNKGISQLVKYQTLESYEDVLNNLVLQQKSAADLFSEKAREQYQLKYMLDMESRGHLFDINIFQNPFSYTLNITQNNEQVPMVVDLVETFNYLIGLYVQRMQRVKDDKRDIKLVEGKTREGKKTLVIWRNLELTTNEETQKVFRKIYDGVRSAEFDQIFINGDHHFENMRIGEDSFKIKLIEEVFFKKMFEG